MYKPKELYDLRNNLHNSSKLIADMEDNSSIHVCQSSHKLLAHQRQTIFPTPQAAHLCVQKRKSERELAINGWKADLPIQGRVYNTPSI